jgi:flagellar assembly protein FliH
VSFPAIPDPVLLTAVSKVIPKEQLTAYQRWELAPFDELGDDASRGPGVFRPPEEVDGGTGGVALPTAGDIERLHHEAWQEGYNLGLEEGRKAGFDEGMSAGQQHAERLKALAEALDIELLRQDEQVAQEVLALSLAVAQEVVRVALRVRPELMMAAIREAVVSLPSMDGHYRIVVHTEFKEMVRDWLAREHSHLSWTVLEDPTLEPGSFRFESTHSELDASMRTRWLQIVQCLGADGGWLE